MFYINSTDKQYIRLKGFEEIAIKAKNKGYICPVCGSGSGKKGTGIITKDNIHYKCFACGWGGDIFDYVGVYFNIVNKQEQLTKTAQLLNIGEPVKEGRPAAEKNKNAAKIFTLQEQEKKGPKYTEEELKEKRQKAYDYYYKWAKDLYYNSKIGMEYMTARGFTRQNLAAYMIGYIRTNKFTKSGKTCNFIVIPITDYYYILRGCGFNFNFKRNVLLDGFNVALWTPLQFNPIAPIPDKYKNIIVCEGCMDALTCLELNYNTISLNSTSNKDKFVEYAKEHKEYNYIIEMDNDRAGEAATTAIIDRLKDTNVNYKVCNIVKTYKGGVFKDLNDCLMDSKTDLKKHINSIICGRGAADEKEIA